MKPRAMLLTLSGAAITLLSLPVWFITLMAVIAGRSWSLATGLVGLVVLGIGVAFLYMAYNSLQEEKKDDARYHNMERQVLALAKKNRGSVTVADLMSVGFESGTAEDILDKMARKGICDINLDATQASGITTYSFPTLIPLGEETDMQEKV
jgi:hypothetical protein